MKKLKNHSENLQHLLFLDIETCALTPQYVDLNPKEQSFWDNKSRQLKRIHDPDYGASKELFYTKRSGIYAEFARVVCISVGYIDVISKQKAIVITKSFYNINETSLLLEFSNFLNDKTINHGISFLCGHNIKEFDIPFLCRRMLINNVKLPEILCLSGKKPWQVPFVLDTLNMWKFGDYKNYISLDFLCHILNIDSSKSEMSGSDVHDFFWIKKDHIAICKYCEQDVFCTALIYMKIKQIGSDLNFVAKSKTAFDSLKINRPN